MYPRLFAITNTFEDGSVASASIERSGQEDVTTAEGVLLSLTKGADPRFGFQSPLPAFFLEQIPSGLTTTVGVSEIAELSDRFDPLSLTSLNRTVSDNGRNYSYSYDSLTRTEVFTSPEGRLITKVLDGQTRR